MKINESILSMCLYFTSNRFARYMTKMAEEVFEKLQLSPTYVYLLVIVNQYPGITQKELCEKLSIAPSTSTRFIDKLEKLELVYRRLEWKETNIHLTEKGIVLCEEIDECFDEFYKQYTSILGEENNHVLAKALYESSEILKKERSSFFFLPIICICK
ncbi:MarR family winged helix-turn-helix transcriptional regulator [Niallia sp. Krafla_26]|uniref:MarR family winged helix-turn-helix transcriptional regulator n=1 Tax=Niallia sp. Krafla_26 TaxID=3064703 RepID=UPI003D16B334